MDVWIVGKVNPTNYKEWEFQGVFSNEQAAIAVCIDENFFIGRATIDSIVPVESVTWPGAYYPKRIPNEFA